MPVESGPRRSAGSDVAHDRRQARPHRDRAADEGGEDRHAEVEEKERRLVERQLEESLRSGIGWRDDMGR
jgi:hypothetical protein